MSLLMVKEACKRAGSDARDLSLLNEVSDDLDIFCCRFLKTNCLWIHYVADILLNKKAFVRFPPHISV